MRSGSSAIAAPNHARSPRLEFRGHARAGSARAEIRQERDRSADRRAHLERPDDALGLADVEQRLVALLLRHRDVGAGRQSLTDDLRFELAHVLFRVRQGDEHVLRFDPRPQRVRLHVEPRAIGSLLRFADFAFRRRDPALLFGLGPLDLRLGLFQLRLLRLERPLLCRRIELDDDISRCDLVAVLHELNDLQVRAARRRGENHRAHGTDFAAQLQEVDEGRLCDDGGRERRSAVVAIARDRGRGQRARDEDRCQADCRLLHRG